MKLATYDDGSRDGQLVVVSRDLGLAHFASGIASRLQQVLDDWNFLSPQLEDLATTLNHGRARHAFAFDPRLCMAPLPRAALLLWAEGAYPAPDAAPPPRLRLLRGDALAAPQARLRLDDAQGQLDLGAGWVAVTGDLARGADEAQALEAVRLLGLANLPRLQAAPSFPGPPADDDDLRPLALAPVLVTPDELGPAWRDGRPQLTLQVVAQGRRLGQGSLGAGMTLGAGAWLAAAARHRRLRAGTMLGAGPVREAGQPLGLGCLADRLQAPAAHERRGRWLQPGDALRIEAFDAQGQSVFGALQSTVTGPGGALGAADAPGQAEPGPGLDDAAQPAAHALPAPAAATVDDTAAAPASHGG